MCVLYILFACVALLNHLGHFLLIALILISQSFDAYFTCVHVYRNVESSKRGRVREKIPLLCFAFVDTKTETTTTTTKRDEMMMLSTSNADCFDLLIITAR